MIYGSVCSGIEAATVAWGPLGWAPAFFSEVEPFPCAVLAHHYPNVPNLGDMTQFKGWPEYAIDLLVGGTPCQSFSVAGLRKGLDDPRGNLALTYLAVADKYRPRWLVWENVPGVLSSNAGRDFGSFLGGLGKLGYGFAYRILDAQYFGLAQRRRRVFVVGCLGDWRRAAAVLFERESLSGHPAPSRGTKERVACPITASFAKHGGASAGKDGGIRNYVFGGVETALNVATTIPSRSTGGGGLGTDFDCDGGLIVHSLRAEGFDASEDGTGGGTPLVPVTTLAIRGRGDSHQLEYRQDGTANAILTPNGGRAGIGVGAVHYDSSVRRLTPGECARLQGFQDDYLDIEYRGKPAADGPKYKALGNSFAVPVVRWIGRRIQFVETMKVAA